MSINQETDILDEVVRRLVDAFQPERIYLFGSRARGDNHEDSDYDLLIVLREPDGPTHERTAEAYRVLQDVRVSIDVLIWSQKEFGRQAPVISSLSETVLYEGQLVYGS